MRAQYETVCAHCREPIRRNTFVDPSPKGWIHALCAHILEIRNGETYRSQKPSTWKRR